MAKMYQALLDNVFVKETKKTRKVGVLDIPDTIDSDFTFGTVVSVGEGNFEHGNYIPNCVSVGDEVVFPRTVGSIVNFNGDELIYIKSSDIIAAIKDVEITVDEESKENN
jgi:co-chaperonin GroES (HSP10)